MKGLRVGKGERLCGIRRRVKGGEKGERLREELRVGKDGRVKGGKRWKG